MSETEQGERGVDVRTEPGLETGQPAGQGEGAPVVVTGDRPRTAMVAGGLAAALGLVVVLVGAAVGIGLLLSGGDEFEVTAGGNLPVNQDTASVAAHNSPTIARSPAAPETLVVAGRIDRPQLSAALHVSKDGGRSWADVSLPVPPGEQSIYTPDVAFDARGTLYGLFVSVPEIGNVPSALWLTRSTDAGDSFSAPVRVGGPFALQPRLAVDARSGNVHVTWLQATDAIAREVAEVGRQPAHVERTPGLGPPPNPVMMATSTDGGATFSRPVQVSEAKRARVGAATPIVGRDGQVFVLYEDFGDDRPDFDGRPPGPVHKGPFSLVLARSTDQGKSFTTASVVEPEVVPAERFLVYLPKFPSIAVDRERGDLYVAWSDARSDEKDRGNWDVFVRRSDDGGKTWSGRTKVNDDGTERYQYLPQVAVAPDGRVDIAYLDRRDDRANVFTAVSLASSLDRGKSWSSVTVSDTLFDSRVGPRNERTKADTGSRLALVSANDSAFVAWPDTRRGSTDTDKQDIFFAPVRIEPND